MAYTAKKIIIGTAAAGVLLLYFFFDARQFPFPRCPFYALTRFYCPGCGSQRALSSLLHGQLVQALHYNILLVAITPLLLYAAVEQIKHTERQPVKLFYQPVFAWIVFWVIIIFWLLRNLPFYPFIFIAPVE